MAQVGCPDRRIDRLCITCCSPSNLHITPVTQRDFVYRASAAGVRYRSPLAIMAHAIRAILLASAMAATLVGRRPSSAVSQGRPGAMDLGVTDDRECSGHEKAAQIAIALLTYAAEPLLAAT